MRKYIALFIIIILSFIFTSTTNTSLISTSQQDDSSQLEVVVEGEIENPGIFYLLKNDTFEALEKQLIFTKDSDLSCINKNRTILHQDTIFIPSKKIQKYSLNDATEIELMNIKGIGPVIASKIIEYRNLNPFISIEEIMNISGIGEKTYYKLRDYLCL